LVLLSTRFIRHSKPVETLPVLRYDCENLMYEGKLERFQAYMPTLVQLLLTLVPNVRRFNASVPNGRAHVWVFAWIPVGAACEHGSRCSL
jgi:hypothetical protein